MLYSIAVEACKSLVDWNMYIDPPYLHGTRSRLARASWIEMIAATPELQSASSRLARASWIEMIAFIEWVWSGKVEACKSLVDWNTTVLPIVLHATGRGLQEPRGLKLKDLQEVAANIISRGLQEPRGLKWLQICRMGWFEAVEACKSLVDWNRPIHSRFSRYLVEACKSLVDWNT